MRTKTLVLALGLAVLAVAASTTYVLAYRGSGSSYYSTTSNVAQVQDEAWWNDMRTYMQQHGQDNKDDAWWNEMRQYMEEHWTELEDGGYSYGGYSYGGYGGYDGCGGMRW
jgi:sensor domain CHASE-containing protein